MKRLIASLLAAVALSGCVAVPYEPARVAYYEPSYYEPYPYYRPYYYAPAPAPVYYSPAPVYYSAPRAYYHGGYRYCR